MNLLASVTEDSHFFSPLWRVIRREAKSSFIKLSHDFLIFSSLLQDICVVILVESELMAVW